MEIKLRFWGQFGEIDCQTGEDAYEMIYGDKFCFNDYAPINNLLDNPYIKSMLFSGLKDKNGKEWYTGDYDENKNVVEFRDGCFFLGSLPLALSANHRTISGNIYENPELLS
jgi:hypothetical protein